MNRHRSARKLAGAVDAPAAASTTVSSDSLTDRQETFFADIARLSDAVYRSDPRIPDRRREHPSVTGCLGDPFAPVWFIAEAPSLTQVERPSKSSTIASAVTQRLACLPLSSSRLGASSRQWHVSGYSDSTEPGAVQPSYSG